VISVADFVKQYDSTLAADGLTFRVEPGQIMGLIGPNGAGKTTTLKALSGVVRPTRGTISLCGLSVTNDSVATKRVLSYIPDDPPLFPDLTVDQHLAFAGAAYAVADSDSRAQELLDEFQLCSKRKTLARDLSRGMRQKLAICCGYLHDPSVILFDEPLTGLDPVGIRTLKETIVRRAAAGAAIIVSSHLLAMVENLCSHVLILDSGLQRFFGPLEELKSSFVDRQQAADLERIFFMATGDKAELQPLGA